MKSNIYNKVRKVSIAVVLLAMSGLMVSCSQDDETATANSTQLTFDISDATIITRATTDAAMVTTFETGDVAGLYIVKDGSVKYENLKLTLSDLGSWQTAAPISVDGLSGATFYIYYPYSALATFDVSAAEPLKAYVDGLILPADQSDVATYKQNDVMVGSTSTVSSNNTVSVKLQHQKSVVCMELPNTSYTFSNPGLNPYVLSKAENVSFTMDDMEVEPYLDAVTQSYRYLVTPGETGTLKVIFTNNGVEKKYEVTNLSQLAAGQYAKYVVDGGVQSTAYGTLQVGDYYCADGKLVSKDAGTVPSNVVGIIYKIGTPASVQTVNTSWCHAVVVALEEMKAAWGTSSSTTSAQNNAGWKYWYRSYGLSDQNGKTDAAKLDENIMVEDGYENTIAWRTVPEPLTIGDYTLDYTTVMNATFSDWIAGHTLPALTTGWYIPSLVDWRNMEGQQETLDAQLEKVGGTVLSGNPYWSSNIRNASSGWAYVLGQTEQSKRYKGSGYKDSRLYRFVFAF